MAKFAPYANRYLVLHDTSVDGEEGECVRLGRNLTEVGRATGLPEQEVARGLWQAVEEFLSGNAGGHLGAKAGVEGLKWRLRERRLNNNGLTVLERRRPRVSIEDV